MPHDHPLHVHLVIDGLGVGGAETLLADLVVGGREAGLSFTATTLQDRGNTPGADRLRAVGVEPEILGMSGLLNPRDHRRFRTRLRDLGPDVVHSHLAYADLFAGVAARRLHVPCVSTIHVMRWAESPRERLKLQLQARARRAGMQAVICVSDAARATYLAQGWPSPDRVWTVRNGIDAHARPDAAGALRDVLGIPADALVIGTLSVLREGKGHEVLFAAIPALRDRFGDLHVLVAGDGPDSVSLTAAAQAAGARTIGQVSDPVAYAGALDVLVHPSHVDALPTALMEAAAAGTPVVATRVGGIPEIVDEGETGLLIPAPPQPAALAETTGALLADPARRAAMADAARARYAEDFSATRWARRMRTVYEEAIVARGRHHAKPDATGRTTL